MPLAHWYPKGLQLAMNKEVDWDTDTIKVALFTNSHTVNDLHDYFNDVSANEVAAGGGYTAGGETLGTKAVNFTDDSAATAWAASTSYALGDLVRPGTANGHLYMCIIAGTSGTMEPTFPTVARNTVADNTVTWAEVGRAVVDFDAADTVWSSSTITARFAIVYVDTGTPATSALLGLVDFESDQSSSNGDFTIQWSTQGILRLFGGFALS